MSPRMFVQDIKMVWIPNTNAYIVDQFAGGPFPIIFLNYLFSLIL